jgi:SprB repeat
MYAGETMSLTVTAPNGCKATDTHTIHSLPIPAPVISASGPLNCAGDSVTLSASGLLPGTSYQWGNGKTTASIRVAPEVPTAYILTATRSGCVGISNVLTLSPPTALSMVDTLVQPICYGTATGHIGISVAGGTLPYLYVWSNGASTTSINNLRAGTYSVTVTDGKGCSLVESFLLGSLRRCRCC